MTSRLRCVVQGRYLGQPVAVKVQGLCLDDQDDLDELSVEVCVWGGVGAGAKLPGCGRTLSLLPGHAPAAR